MRNAGSEISSTPSSRSPTSATPVRMPAAITLARMATLLRAARGMPSVTTKKVGAMAIGSTTTNTVTKA